MQDYLASNNFTEPALKFTLNYQHYSSQFAHNFCNYQEQCPQSPFFSSFSRSQKSNQTQSKSMSNQKYDSQSKVDSRNTKFQSEQSISSIGSKLSKLKLVNSNNQSEVKEHLKITNMSLNSLNSNGSSSHLTIQKIAKSYQNLKRRQQIQCHSLFKKQCYLEETKPETELPSIKFHFVSKQTDQNQSTNIVKLLSKDPFTNCKLTESHLYFLNNKKQLRMEQSVILQRSVLDLFLILSRQNSKNKHYDEFIGVEKRVGFLVSLKFVANDQIQKISNEVNVLRHVGQDCEGVLKNYTGFVSKNKYVFVRQYYDSQFENLNSFTSQDSAVELIRQLITLFEHFVIKKIQYKQKLIDNICKTHKTFKLKNFEHCLINQTISQSLLKRKYLRLIKQLLCAIFEIETIKPYYSNKLQRDMQPEFVIFMNELGKGKAGFNDLRESKFLNRGE